jgi:hypothetical protein
MRFDLPDPMGTCYVSEGDEGAFLEVFQDWLVIPRAEIDARRISRHLHLPAPWTVADCTNPLSRGFGLTAEIHSTPLRALTQAWAKQFQEEGFAGVRYKVGHDPSQTRTAIALFHAAGEASWSFPVPESIGDDLINRIEATFGVRVR